MNCITVLCMIFQDVGNRIVNISMINEPIFCYIIMLVWIVRHSCLAYRYMHIHVNKSCMHILVSVYFLLSWLVGHRIHQGHVTHDHTVHGSFIHTDLDVHRARHVKHSLYLWYMIWIVGITNPPYQPSELIKTEWFTHWPCMEKRLM